MNTIRKTALAALVLALGTTFAAQAQTQDNADRRAKFEARVAEMTAKREAKLHDALKITPAQEPAWAAYVTAIKPVAPTGTPPAPGTKLSAPERLAKAIDFSKQRTARLESVQPALTAFYGQLTAEQKAIFDKRGGGFGGPARGPRGHGFHGGWGGHHG
ncbi:Spy/CpxP family protein refolding chaperone [Oxalobacteraceae bacterium A2-2]